MGPRPHSSVLSVEQEAIIVAFRKHTLWRLLDDLFASWQVTYPHGGPTLSGLSPFPWTSPNGQCRRQMDFSRACAKEAFWGSDHHLCVRSSHLPSSAGISAFQIRGALVRFTDMAKLTEVSEEILDRQADVLADIEDPRIQTFNAARMRESFNKSIKWIRSDFGNESAASYERAAILDILSFSGVRLTLEEFSHFKDGADIQTILTHRLQAIRLLPGCALSRTPSLMVCRIEEHRVVLHLVGPDRVIVAAEHDEGYDDFILTAKYAFGTDTNEDAAALLFSDRLGPGAVSDELVAEIARFVRGMLPHLHHATAVEVSVAGLAGRVTWMTEAVARALRIAPLSELGRCWAATHGFDLGPAAPDSPVYTPPSDPAEEQVEDKLAEEPGTGAEGYLYILANSCMPGLLKIGFTERDPELRAAELSAATAAPVPFILVYYRPVRSAAAAERELHRRLAAFRQSDNREFFRMQARDAIFELEEAAGAYDVCHDAPATTEPDGWQMDEWLAAATAEVMRTGNTTPFMIRRLLGADHASSNTIFRTLIGRGIIGADGERRTPYHYL